MMTHHLILFYGSSSGAGKTTLSDWLQHHLQQQAIPVEWIEEDHVLRLDIFSAVVQAFEHRQGDPIATVLDAARQLVERYQLSDKIVIMDSIFPSYTWLYAAGVSLSQAAQFNQQLAGMLAPLKPLVVFLDGDGAVLLQRAIAQRGEGWLTENAEAMDTYRHVPVRPVRGFDEVAAFFSAAVWFGPI
jgi:thymidylate kinase